MKQSPSTKLPRETKTNTTQQTQPHVTNPALYRFPGDDQLLNRIGQVERFSEEERQQFGMHIMIFFLNPDKCMINII